MKRNRIIIISGVLLLLALLVYVVQFILNAPYRNQIPSYPDPATLLKPEREQVVEVSRQVYYHTSADNLGKLGMVYYACANYEKAARCYQLAIQKDSSKWIWNYYLGYLNLEQDDADAAIKNFTSVIERDPANSMASYYTGEAYLNTGATDRAKMIFEKIIDAGKAGDDEKNAGRENYFPLKTYAMFQLARIYANANLLDSAEAVLKTIIDEKATFGPAYRALGNVYSLKGDSSLAGKYTTRANDLADYTPMADNLVDEIAWLSHSDKYLLKQMEDAVHSGNHRLALKLCNLALSYYPDNKYFLSTAVFENLRRGLDKKALSYLDKHFTSFSNDAKELMDVTDLLYNKGHGAEALRYFEQVKKLLPQNSTLALWLYDRGKKQEAVVMMNELNRNNPENIKILTDITRLLLNMGDDEQAKEYADRLNRLAPASPEVLKIKGLMAEKQGDLKQASAVYEEACKLDPKDLIFSKEIIDIYIRQKDWQQAIRHFRLALGQYPNEPFLLEGLGRLLISCPDPILRNVQEGIEYSQRAFISNKSMYETRLSAGKNLATVYVSLGDKKNAVKYINETIDIARQGKNQEEYIAYFKTLVSAK